LITKSFCGKIYKKLKGFVITLENIAKEGAFPPVLFQRHLRAGLKKKAIL